uniref:Katanin catalytic subunit A1 n=1 Tax=Gasterosteus aculeatus aculeatus TaxID=481459 RepID=A0AAQ4R7J8_GASAC
MSLQEINENVKLAREYALLGNYTSASVLYHGLLDQIRKYVYTVRDSSFQQRWQQLWQEISEENRQVQEIMLTLENFQLDTTPAKPSNHDDCDIRPVHVEQRHSPCPVRRPANQYKDSKPTNNRLSVAVRAQQRPSARASNGDRGKASKGKEKRESKEAAGKVKDDKGQHCRPGRCKKTSERSGRVADVDASIFQRNTKTVEGSAYGRTTRHWENPFG